MKKNEEYEIQLELNNGGDSLKEILDKLLSKYGRISKKAASSEINEETKELREITSKSADLLLKRLKLMAVGRLENAKETEREFEAAVLQTWRTPLDLMNLLLYLCLEVNSDFVTERGSKTSNKNYVRTVLAKEQIKACLVFNQILHLLKNGFPSGALLHWKALHEITCVSYFILKYKEDLAKRFLDYEVVERYFQAEAIMKHQKTIGSETLSEIEFEELKKEFSRTEKTYGKDFVKKANYPYGWVPHEILKTRSLKEIEKTVNLDMFKSFYDLASYNFYAGPEGLIFKPVTAFVHLGPSNYGLADPGQVAAISLGQVTSCLLRSECNIRRLIIVEVLRNLVDEISVAFSEIKEEFGGEAKPVTALT